MIRYAYLHTKKKTVTKTATTPAMEPTRIHTSLSAEQLKGGEFKFKDVYLFLTCGKRITFVA